ncbi:MAG: hypothetical protein UW69_C0008G0050 [Microgenomates group bacterium GW2011_GWA2_44_7]|nr:MAG: hypothetical protein UW69_C0008G0050 [Microgenomates group bacterium GW2011_GWA2_44_7]
MIIIIHGQDEVASRKYLFELIKNTKGETVRAGKSDLEGDNLSKALSDISLFAQERTIIIENFLKIKSLVLKENAKNLFNNFSGTIIFWEDGQRPATLLSSFGKAKILEFKIQSSVFRFLDAIKPNQGQGNVSLFKQALIRSSPEIIFYGSIIKESYKRSCLH